MKSWKTIAVFCAVFCTGYCANRNNQNERQKTANEVMGPIEGLFWNTWQYRCYGPAFDNIYVEMAKFEQCVYPLVEKYLQYPDDLSTSITNLSDRPTLQLLINTICGGFSTIRKCLRPFVYATQVCLTSTEKKSVNSIWDAVFAGTDYACSDKGARYIELLETGVEKCVKSRDIGLSECNYKLSTNFMGDDMQELLEFNSHNCKALSDARSCVVSELKQCPNKRPAEIMGQFFGVVLQKLPCGFHFNSSAPTAVKSNWKWLLTRLLKN